jgi:osmotically-inducible protein OsmY
MTVHRERTHAHDAQNNTSMRSGSMSDKVIIDEIRAALDSDSRLPHPAEIAVAQQAGTVTLRGSVGSFRQRRAAVQIAKSARGVQRVDDQLSVDPRDRWEDNQIRGAALQALMSNDSVPADQIEVHVDAGWLTLKGEVKHQHESDAAFEAVSRLPGVGGITNEIKVITAGIH